MTGEELDEAWQVLNEREKRIITLRFGLEGGEPQTLKAIGVDIGCNRARARVLEGRALAKLRRAGLDLAKNGELSPTWFVKKTVQPVTPKILKVKRRKKLKLVFPVPGLLGEKPEPEPLPAPPKYSDTKRMNWLEKWVLERGSAIRMDLYGVTLYSESGGGKMWGKDLRELIDLAIHRKVFPKSLTS